MSLLSKVTGPYSGGTFTLAVTCVLPDRFRLSLRLGRLSRSARPLFRALGTVVEFETRTLLATAPLRHGGTPYSDGDAIAKETLLWMGWLGVHQTGPLEGRLLVNALAAGPGNVGRS